MISKTELIDRVWYAGNSLQTRCAQWLADKQIFSFGIQYPGSDPSFSSLYHVEDNEAVAFTPVSILKPQLPLQNWTPSQCIRASDQLRTQDEQG